MLEPKKWLVKAEDEDLLFKFSWIGFFLDEIHHVLPREQILQIEFEPYAVDPSGYEYFGWILYTR